MAQDDAAFRRFISEASITDAGEADARKHYGSSLGLLIAQILGNGDWLPKPDQWDVDSELLRLCQNREKIDEVFASLLEAHTLSREAEFAKHTRESVIAAHQVGANKEPG